jgi:uncharacterized membrane protein
MVYLVMGLFIFFGTHSLRLAAGSAYQTLYGRLGDVRFKLVYTVLSVLGLFLVVFGFGLARETPVMLWSPPAGMRHLTFLLMLVAMVFLAAAYVPRNAIRARLHHPMVLSVKVWALAHLACNGSLAHMVLFGTFLLWSVWAFRASRLRDRVDDVQYPIGAAMPTLLTVAIGAGLWLVMIGWLHGVLMGVRLLA